MHIFEIFLIGIGLSMDAFAIAICKGLSHKKITWKLPIVVAFYFGFFQAIMPLIGYFLGSSFQQFITTISHWIAFFLLLFIGINMIRSTKSETSSSAAESLLAQGLLLLAIATSIDALVVGITFSFLSVNILQAILIIGCITFILSALGVWIGNQCGNLFHHKAEMLGGIILILMGIKILLEHFHLI